MTCRMMLVMKDLGDSADFKKKNFKIIISTDQGGIKCGNRGTGFLDSEGSHR